jgi:hypothetical protein
MRLSALAALRRDREHVAQWSLPEILTCVFLYFKINQFYPWDPNSPIEVYSVMASVPGPDI